MTMAEYQYSKTYQKGHRWKVLEFVRKWREITYEDVAEALDISTSGAWIKLTGKTDWTLCEARTLHQKLFPDIDFDLLFSDDLTEDFQWDIIKSCSTSET